VLPFDAFLYALSPVYESEAYASVLPACVVNELVRGQILG